MQTTAMDLNKIYEYRPFKTKNADEFDLVNILDLFVDPTRGLRNPFDYENTIIKGGMGSGKTMYLRANYAYYLSQLVPCILEKQSIIVPIYIRLSDFQGMSDVKEIYRRIIIKVIDELLKIEGNFEDSKRLARMHLGITALPKSIHRNDAALTYIKKLSAEEYVEKVSNGVNIEGSAANDFFSLAAQYSRDTAYEIKTKPEPSIQDINNLYDTIIKPFDGKILLLFDEAGSVNKSFFREDIGQESMFEVLMNQLRTSEFVRTKIAIYPNHASDILTEARYGQVFELEEKISTEDGYLNFRNKVIGIVEKYIENEAGIKIDVEDFFMTDSKNIYGDIIEQIIYASDGNMRRLIHLLDVCMDVAYMRNMGRDKIHLDDVFRALHNHGREMERLFSEMDTEILNSLCTTCRSRSTYRFSYAGMGSIMQKYANKSQEYNLMKIAELGSGRKGTIYEFDYAYCVYKEVPTHYVKGTERIDKTRSLLGGEWIKRVTKVTTELIEHANLIGKIEGEIIYVDDSYSAAFVKGEDGVQYLMQPKDIIRTDQNKKYYITKRIRFLPAMSGDVTIATEIEIL